MFSFILTVHVIICVVLIFIVLLQSGKGAELGAAFGGAGQSESIRTPETFISKLTAWMAAMFMITSATLVLLSTGGTSDSVVDRAPTESAAPAAESSDQSSN